MAFSYVGSSELSKSMRFRVLLLVRPPRDRALEVPMTPQVMGLLGGLAPPWVGTDALARRPLLQHLPLALASLYGYPSGTRRALRRSSPARRTPEHNDPARRPLLPLRGDAHTPWCPGTRLEDAPLGVR